MSRSPLIADDQQLDLCEWLETAGATHDHEATDPSADPGNTSPRMSAAYHSLFDALRRLHAEAAHD